MEQAIDNPFNRVIDEFHEFYRISESVYSDMQNIWNQCQPSIYSR